MMEGKLVFRVHAIARIFERRITEEEVRTTLEGGETIENYPDDTPYPSRLMLGWAAGRPIHVVAADNRQDEEVIVITVYEPDPDLWEPGFKRRKP
jgi:hypothetical protein